MYTAYQHFTSFSDTDMVQVGKSTINSLRPSDAYVRQ